MSSFLANDAERNASDVARGRDDLARLALRALVLLEQGMPPSGLEPLNAALQDASSPVTSGVPASERPWFAKASEVVDSVQRLSSATWAREAAESVLEAVVGRGAALVWLTDLDLRIRYALALGTIPFDPYDGFVGSDLFEYFGTSDTGHPAVAAHLDAIRGRRGEFPLREGAVEIPIRVEPVRDAKGDVVGCCARALPAKEGSEAESSEHRRRLEEELRQSQKLEAVGRLAAWVAHDFNNLLTTILGYSDLILAEGVENDELRSDVEAIREAGRSATALTRQLLAFTKREVRRPQTIHLSETFASLARTLGRLMGEDVDVVVRTEPGLAPVHFDPGELEQIILSLAVRAREAMPAGGRLVIEAKPAETTPGGAIPSADARGYVRISMTDSGELDPADPERTVDPYVSPDRGAGPGFRLETLSRIVEDGCGHLFVHREPRAGTIFDVFLPRSEGPLRGPALPVRREAAADAAQRQTVLLVEDAKEVRDLARRVLSENGYRVLEAENGAEALLVSSAHQGPIRLLLSDVVMPLMSGPEAARRLLAIRPEMKVLYMSGYTGDAILRNGLGDPAPLLLEKPFTPEDLLLGVRGALEA
jgi:signal transduction histidine kinase/CheY-like chemotaxis protein